MAKVFLPVKHKRGLDGKATLSGNLMSMQGMGRVVIHQGRGLARKRDWGGRKPATE